MNSKVASFSEALQRSSADTKYTVRVPFFGVAFDVNDVGMLGGVSLWIVLILLRLALRSQIVSLRIGFKRARYSDQEEIFFEVLAARQVFVFPRLSDRFQEDSAARGWIEYWWLQSRIGRTYRKLRNALSRLIDYFRQEVTACFNVPVRSQHDDVENDPSSWRANRNVALRSVPKLLSLLPFIIYAVQYYFDVRTIYYGYALDTTRAVILLSVGGFLLLNIMVLGVLVRDQMERTGKTLGLL